MGPKCDYFGANGRPADIPRPLGLVAHVPTHERLHKRRRPPSLTIIAALEYGRGGVEEQDRDFMHIRRIPVFYFLVLASFVVEVITPT